MFIDWKIACSLSFSCTASTRLRTFHFKYLHRRISINVFLAKCKLEANDKCSFCEDEPKTLIHLFLQCPLTKQFWQNVLNWINTHPDHENVELSENMLLGLANWKTVISNLLILIARYYIFLSKTRKEKPNLTAYKERVKYFYYIEKEISFQQGKRVEFLKKWRPFFLHTI